MPRTIAAGVLQLFYAATVADPAAPTVAELNAAVNLTPWLTGGTLTTPLDGSIVAADDMDSPYNKSGAGTFGGDPVSAEFYRDTTRTSDTAWTTLVRGVTGYWAIARLGLATKGTWASGDRVELWPVTVVTRNMISPVPRNEMQRFMVTCGVPTDPNIDYALT